MLSLAGLIEDSIVDGPGIRLTVFAQGCPHRCPGCHNPESWPFEGGTPMEEERLVEVAKSNPLCRGVTFSGGEPFAQAEGFAWLGRLLKAAGYEVASYSGYTFEELFEGSVPFAKELLAQLDILVDGRYEQAQRTLELRFRGSANQRVIDVPASLAAGHAVECTANRWVGKHL